MNSNRDSNENAVRLFSNLVGDAAVEKASEGSEAEFMCQPCEKKEELFGKRTMAVMQLPFESSPAKVEEHEKTHLPFRSWCRHCVRGRRKEASHFLSKNEPGGLPEFHFDWCFLCEEETQKTLTVLVRRMRGTRMIMSTLMPSTTTGEFAANRIMAYLRECGCEIAKIAVKSDQEPAVLSMLADVNNVRAEKGAAETIPEHSPTYASQSNGIVERGIQSVEGMIRALRSALEERISAKLDIEDDIWPWLIEYAGSYSTDWKLARRAKPLMKEIKERLLK